MTTHPKLDILLCIKLNTFVIFSKTTCQTSQKIKHILMQYPGIHDFKIIELDMDVDYHESTMEYMETLFHIHETPCIFMNANYIPTQEFQNMHEKGTLKQKLIHVGVISKFIEDSIPQHAAALLTVATHRSYGDVCGSVSQIASRFKYGVLHSYNLTQLLRSRGQPCSRDISVYEICHPVHASHVLYSNPWMSCALPCRISVWCDDHGHTMIQTTKPSTLINMMGGNETYNSDSLNKEAQQVEDDLYNIMLQLGTDPQHECGSKH